MELQDNQRHVRFYFWCLDVWDAFCDDWTPRSRSNLCQYLRTMFVLMPLAIFWHVALVCFGVFVLLLYPIATLGWVGTFALYVLTAMCIGAYISGSYLREKMKEAKREREVTSSTDDEVSVTPIPTEDKGPGFLEVVWLYLVAQKQKFCPTIEFRPAQKKEGV